MKRGLLFVLLLLVLLSGCSTLKGWFTPQGQKLSQAQAQADQGHPLAASALAVEALTLEPDYEEARSLVFRTFEAGQQEFRDEVVRWQASTEPQRWDHLYDLYRWQDILHTRGGALSPLVDSRTKVSLELLVVSVADQKKEAGWGAAVYHWERAQKLLEKAPGPRQARLALAEGRVAAGFDAQAPGLADWMVSTQEAATQRLMVVPFYLEATGKLGALSGPLGSAISKKLLEQPGLPPLTTVFPSDRLVTLPGGGPARAGLISQPDALKLAASAGQNLVLMGQFTQAGYQEPQKSVKSELREKKAVLVDPQHPEGVEKVYKAVVTTTKWTTEAWAEVSFSVVEVPTTQDVVTATRQARVKDEVVLTMFTGDREALTIDDLQAIGDKSFLVGSEDLRTQLLSSLASAVAEVVRSSLR